jgi:hypothetical protein
MHDVVSAIVGITPTGLPRSSGFACCSTEAKKLLKSIKRTVLRTAITVHKNSDLYKGKNTEFALITYFFSFN